MTIGSRVSSQRTRSSLHATNGPDRKTTMSVHVLRAAPIGLRHHELFRRSAVQRSDIETGSGSGGKRSEEKMAAVSKKLWTAVCSLIGFQLRDGNRIASRYLDSCIGTLRQVVEGHKNCEHSCHRH